VIRRGEIWWADLPAPVGSEPGYRRPLLVIQTDAFNRSGIRTVMGVILTTNQGLATAPGNVLLPRRSTGLPRDSVANVSQVVTANKDALTERVGALPSDLLTKVEDGLRFAFEL